MPRRSNQKAPVKAQASDGNDFGLIDGSSQKSLKEMFGNLTGGTSQVFRSIRNFTAATGDGDDQKKSRLTKGSKMSAESSHKARPGDSTLERGSRPSRRSKAEKSTHSKRTMKSGIIPSGRVPQARGFLHHLLLCARLVLTAIAGFGDQTLLMEYKSPSLGLQLTEALSDEALADVTVSRMRKRIRRAGRFPIESLLLILVPLLP